MTRALEVAAARATAGAIVAAGAAFFAALSQGASTRAAGIIAGAAFFAYLATRGVAEGVIDQVASPSPPAQPPTARVGP